MSDAKTLFKRHFGESPSQVVRAPGRLELLGNHTDYNGGLVLSIAVDKCIECAVAPRTDGKIALVSSAFDKPEIFWLDRLQKNPAAAWADYAKGTLAQLKKTGVHFSGFNAAFHSTIPIGGGMGSSSAFEISVALAVRRLFPFGLKETGITTPPKPDSRGHLPALTQIEKMALARLCGAVENEFIGARTGLLDQTSSLFGKAWHAMEIDFQSLTVEHAPLTGEAIVVCDSGGKHSLAESGYNELRQNCESAAKALGVRSLRAVDQKFLAANLSRLSVRESECARHIVGEIQRAFHAARALRENDHRLFGELMFLSHESSRDLLRNSTPELDQLVELARGCPGCLGARLTGGGFGGATINLVAHHQASEFMEEIARRYHERTGKTLQPMLCEIADGAN